MPRPTWGNLPEGKRLRILHVAMGEFGEHGFSAGSLNVIARDAGIAKGSLFQYFDDKLDLFATVCEEAANRIQGAVIDDVLDLAARQPFFDALEDILDLWVAYFADHPLERGVTAATHLEMDGDVRSAVRGVAHSHYLAVLRPLVTGARTAGHLRPDADLDALISWLLLLLPQVALAPYVPSLDPVLGMYGLDPQALRPLLVRLVATLRAGFGLVDAPTGSAATADPQGSRPEPSPGSPAAAATSVPA